MWPFSRKNRTAGKVTSNSTGNKINQPDRVPNAISIDEVTVLVRELIEIGIRDTYYWNGEQKNTLKYDERGNNRRAIEIGAKLNDLKLMQLAHSEVLTKCGSASARSLELVWDKVGEWWA